MKRMIVALFLSLNFVYGFSLKVSKSDILIRLPERLNKEEKDFIQEDLEKRLDYGIVGAYVVANRFKEAKLFAKNSCGDKTLSKSILIDNALKIEGDKYIFVPSKKVIRQYQEKRKLFLANKEAFDKLVVFIDYLNSNNVVNMTSHELRNLVLSKSYLPGECPWSEIETIKYRYFADYYFYPSITEFMIREGGPEGKDYLWGIILAKKNDQIKSRTVIYYKNRWMMSYWFPNEIKYYQF